MIRIGRHSITILRNGQETPLASEFPALQSNKRIAGLIVNSLPFQQQSQSGAGAGAGLTLLTQMRNGEAHRLARDVHHSAERRVHLHDQEDRSRNR